jgi:hypothetical protein
MKKEIIVQVRPGSHLHDFLIQQELCDGRLLSIAGRHLKGGRVELTAARRRDLPHGPIAKSALAAYRRAGRDIRSHETRMRRILTR